MTNFGLDKKSDTNKMDRFSIIIEHQAQIEYLIKDWGFLPFFKNGIEGFSIEEMTPPELLFGDEFNNGPWGWKGPIIANWESAYGKFFKGKAGFISLEWLPDFMNWRRSIYPLKKMNKDSQHIYNVLVDNESMISRQLKKASGFTLSRKRKIFNPDDPTTLIENQKKVSLMVGDWLDIVHPKQCTPISSQLKRKCTDALQDNQESEYLTIYVKCCQT